MGVRSYMDADKALILILFGAVVGIIIFSGIYGLISYAVNKLDKKYVFLFKYLFFSYSKNDGFHFCRFMPVCELMMTRDDETNEESKRCCIRVNLISSAVCIIIIAIIAILWYQQLIGKNLRMFLIGFGAWGIFSAIHRYVLMTKYTGRFDDMLFNHTKAIALKMFDGVSLDDIDIPDYRSYGCPATKPEIANYQCFAFMKKIWQNDNVGLHEIVSSIERNIGIDYINSYREYLASLIGAYYTLLFYYSYININKKKADYIYNIVKVELNKDKDANGRRVLAYYTFFILKNAEKADKYLSEAIEALPEFKCKTERLYEDMLINRLIQLVNEKLYN